MNEAREVRLPRADVEVEIVLAIARRCVVLCVGRLRGGTLPRVSWKRQQHNNGAAQYRNLPKMLQRFAGARSLGSTLDRAQRDSSVSSFTRV